MELANGSQLCLKEKKGGGVWVETLGHNQPEHKSSFEVEILGTRPPP